MPRTDGLPPGTLIMLILRVLATEPLHGYAIAQRIALLSREELSVEEGSLYPALHRMEEAGWVHAEWITKDTGRRARVYGITAAGRKRLAAQAARWQEVTSAVNRVLRTV
jgi:transcriptional regulator